MADVWLINYINTNRDIYTRLAQLYHSQIRLKLVTYVLLWVVIYNCKLSKRTLEKGKGNDRALPLYLRLRLRSITLCFIMFICLFVGPLIWTNKILYLVCPQYLGRKPTLSQSSRKERNIWHPITDQCHWLQSHANYWSTLFIVPSWTTSIATRSFVMSSRDSESNDLANPSYLLPLMT